MGTVIDASYLPFAPNTGVIMPLDEAETIQACKWPTSVDTYDRMRNETKLDGLLRGLLMPIEQWRWAIDPGKADQATALRVAEDLGLPMLGEEGTDLVETESRFDHGEHLRHALLALVYGHYYFEVKGEMRDGAARLVKLAPRPPRTIQTVSISADGGLDWFQQTGYDPPKIPVDRCVLFVWRKEAANWFGRSMLRGCYAPFIAKDRLIRDDLTKHRRNATGMPMMEMAADPTDDQKKMALALVDSYRSADKGGGLIPFGWKLHLQGVEGGTSTPLDSIVYHDGLMAFSFAQMVVDLGNTASGSRGLGETMTDLLQKAQSSIAEWYALTMQRHLIEKFVLWNDGPGAACPKLVFDPNPEPDVAEVQSAVKDGLVQMDDSIENLVRRRLRLPPLDPATVRQQPMGGGTVIDPATGLPAVPFPARRGGGPAGQQGPPAAGG